jgi:hypothetical protein
MATSIVAMSVARMRTLRATVRRCAARTRFAVAGSAVRDVLCRAQVDRNREEGFLLVGGLIPEDVVAGAALAAFECVGASRDDAATWQALGPAPHVLSDDRLLATYSGEVLAAAAQLGGGHVSGYARPRQAFTIHRVPRTGPWKPNGPHLDHSLASERHATFPRPFRVGALTYLSDVVHHGGATLAWPGSHRAVERLARSDERRYAFVTALQADLHRLELGEPVEVLARAGDVLFHHPFTVHASSDDVAGAPRLALGRKW